MRLWLKDSERRPDPAPVTTDDRKAVLAGLALWLVGTVIVLIVVPEPWLIATCTVGLVLGLIGLVYTQHRRRNS
ncbi:putative membrane protein YccC [Conyzicola lurida]|uniref:Putative membrane protein YccC n=1 Tax=Conyzicola lurida TaxID=1172621 RepID=A0A841AK53_9MICO|nr:DUF2530 domain-containing protein [Conyzicola lurida]MBB5842091.1 putative membrane protein YccC [Conyzicola lurida]